jgi:hypothetical protein
MKIPTVPSPDWHLKFARNLDVAIEFHRTNTNDPHNVGNAAVLVLSEVRAMFGSAVCGVDVPTVKTVDDYAVGRAFVEKWNSPEPRKDNNPDQPRRSEA